MNAKKSYGEGPSRHFRRILPASSVVQQGWAASRVIANAVKKSVSFFEGKREKEKGG
jgi:hypothetical protein